MAKSKQGELPEVGNVQIMHISSTKPTKLYALNVMISFGYRVESRLGTMFRIWATERLVQILTKGFYVDKERLKNQGEPNIPDEFREIAREIRTSIRNSHREVLRLCTLCSDYDGSSPSYLPLRFLLPIKPVVPSLRVVPFSQLSMVKCCSGGWDGFFIGSSAELGQL